MDYRVLALKWRPANFDAVVGQQATLRALRQALDSQQLHHAYLFTGTRGVGKTTLARILAKCLQCEVGISSRPCGECGVCRAITSGECVDVIEVDAASRTRVEDTRELLENVSYAPVQARFKIYIIDEVHMLSTHSFNALLKTLEEPPPHVKFILATTDPQKLPVTVLSRCLQFHLRHLNVVQIVQQLEYILQQEQISYESQALREIAQCADGSMRDALSLLEQVIAFCGREITLGAAQQVLGTGLYAQTVELLARVIAGDAHGAIVMTRDLSAQNADLVQILKNLQTLLYKLTLAQAVPEVLDKDDADYTKLQQLALEVEPFDLQLYYQAAITGMRDLPYAPELAIGFEMIILRMIAFRPVSVLTADKINAVASNVAQSSAVANTVTNKSVINKPPVVAAKAVKPELGSSLPKVAASMPVVPAPLVSKPVVPTAIVPEVKPAVVQEVDQAGTNSKWVGILGQLGLQGLTKVLAEHCIVSNWQDDVIELTLDEAQKPLLSVKHIERIQESLQQHLRKSVKVLIKVGAISGETPAVQGQRLRSEAASAAEQAFRQDKHLQQLEQTLGAQIGEIIVTPK